MKMLSQRQFLEMMVLVFKVSGADVTTSDAKTGLLIGQHIATIKKGTGADSNLVTLTLRKPLGMAPSVIFQAVTLDCECRLDVATTKSVIAVRTVLNSNLASKADNANFEMWVIGTEGIYEGRY